MAVRPADDSGYRIGCLGPLVNSRQLGSSMGGDWHSLQTIFLQISRKNPM